MKKEIERLYSIGEAARFTGLSEKTLRFYDEKGVLVPAVRHFESGYRFYTLEQLYLLANKKQAKNVGLPLSRYDDLLIHTNGMSDDDWAGYLEKIDALLDAKEEEMKSLKRAISDISLLRQDVETLVVRRGTEGVFEKWYQEKVLLVFWLEEGEDRQDALFRFADACLPVSEFTSERYGRIFESAAVLQDRIEPKGYYCECLTELSARLFVSIPEELELCVVPSGSRSSFILSQTYESESWAPFRPVIQEQALRGNALLLAAECGYYDDYRKIQYLVRLVEQSAMRAI